MAGFFNDLLRKRAVRLVELFTFPDWQNFFERSNWVNLHGAARLRNNFCQETNHVQKQLLYLLELNFEKILRNTKYVLRCLKTVWNF